MSIAKPAKSENDNIANIKIIKARFAKDGHEFKDCIFNNDTLEIRITDDKYARGLDVSKVSDDDIQNIEEKSLKLVEGFNHGAVAQEAFDHSPTIADLKKQNEDIKENTEFEKPNEGISEGANEGTSEGANVTATVGVDESPPPLPPKIPEVQEYIPPPPQELIPEETGNTVGNIDPADFFAKICGQSTQETQDEWDRKLEEQRKAQGNVFKE